MGVTQARQTTFSGVNLARTYEESAMKKGVKCSAGMIGGIILGIFTGIGVVEIAAAHGIAGVWCYTLGFLGGGMSGLPACLD
jgi:F0F1-type ATP synthase assembly protein I